ncbi:integrase, catalytic region, zinc finger, CCHC-type containing protein [Tanacetum coccineum]
MCVLTRQMEARAGKEKKRLWLLGLAAEGDVIRLEKHGCQVNRPLCLERVLYTVASRFRRYLNQKRDNQKWLLKALDEGPYEFKNFIPEGSTIPRLQTAEDLEGDDLLLHDAEMEVMNMILLSIPNEIYNSVDACTSAGYVETIRLAKRLTVDSFDDLFDYLQQFEKLVNASRAKKLEKSHDPLALVAHTGSSSRQTSSYYVTHPTSVVDYDDEYPGRNACNTSTVQCYNCSGKGHYARNCPKPRVRDSKYFMEQMLLAKQDEAGVILTDEQNDFLFADASRMEEIKELSANICLMARIQPAGHTSDDGPSYESAFISEVQSSSIDENNEPMYPTHTKIINSTIGDDQINSNIKFDSFKGNVNSGSVEKDTHVPDLCAVEKLARNAYQEAEKQQIFAQQVQKQNTHLTSQLEMYKEQCPKLYVASSLGNLEIPLNVRDSEDTLEDAFKSQQKMTEKMNDPIAVANKQNCWTINYKKLNALYKDFVPQKELSVEQKYFPSSSIPSVKIPVSKNMPSESPLIKELDKIKVCFEKLSLLIQQNCKRASIFYTSPAEIQINDFCQDQVKPILNELKVYLEFFRNLFQRDIKEMKDVFESTESELDELEKQNDLLKDQLLEASLKQDVELCVLINHECVDKILNAELEKVKKKSFEIQEGLQARIKILEKDVQRCEKQSVDFQLKLQHEKEKQKWDSTSKNKTTIPLDYSWISKMEKLEDENVSLDFKVQSLIKERDNAKMEYKKLFDSIKKTRSQTQKEMDELIVHVSEKTYAYGAIRAENQNLLSTISELKTRLEKVEKGKSVNTKFDKTNGYQSLLCVTPLNKHAFQKKTDVPKTEENHVVSKPVTLQTSPTKQTGANQNTNVIRPGMYRVVTTQESQTNKTKSALSSTGMNATSRVRRPMSRDSHVAHSVLDNSKKAAKNVAVYVRKNKQTNNTSANVISNKENVIDVDVANASKAKTLLCVSCMQNVLIPCHDKCLAKLKLNVHLNVRRTFFTNSRTSKSSETTFVDPKTRFSKKETQSKTLDTTSVVSKSKIDVESASKAKDKVVQIVLLISSCFAIFTFEPLTLSLTSMPSLDLESLTNILILCLILNASDQSLRKSLSLNLELSW